MGKKYLHTFLFIFIACTLSSQTNKDISSKINVEKQDNFVILRALVENEGQLFKDQLTYNFIALKKGEDGNYSNNKQSGEFSLKPHEEKEQAVIRLNLSNKEELRSYLFIKYKDKLISKDSIWINVKGVAKKRTQGQIENNFVLKGIVTNEAFTKIGRDFHDYFYQAYLLSSRKYPFIIKIKEKPGMGRSSILSIEVEDYKIHEFFSKPGEEYLKAHVKYVLERISSYDKKRREIYKTNKY
ncbi:MULTISPECIES: CsgE family curli-type amyloid fiber assembly protein [Tenacibaculum]|uniref:Curli production assembly/transport component CsgE n=1 Tax=Tenacibaculum todarodis TaxID=1850252 RepID=A0A1L3JIV6_9FLAO|nr:MULTISPECIES: CsgE family curli-type amyloid fiber assembly protein [Tenacibaculum]APG65075.1 hypothetical protein LPB136_06810 [Tenacibaculum todarodis]MCH3884580.1 curli production assembly/transport protein CsgE [Tenacibaculum aquimarinum]